MMPMPWDLTAVQWRIKRWAFKDLPLTIVAPSRWMADLVLRSPIVGGATLECVPNPLDTSVFAPRDRAKVRGRIGLPLSRRVVVYVGKPESVFAYEGRVPLLLEALRLVRLRRPELARTTQLLIVGGRGDELLRSSAFDGVAVGTVKDDHQMADCLYAADLMVDTTQFDNLPAVVQEAMSSGIAIVASDVGGLPDMIDEGVSGLLVDRASPQAFADAISVVLTDAGLCSRLGAQARVVAMDRYDCTRVAAAMLSVYERSLVRFLTGSRS